VLCTHYADLASTSPWASIDALLTGDVDHLSDTTAAELSRLLESSKHLAEVHPVSRSRQSSIKR
jgi:hypothetical protein